MENTAKSIPDPSSHGYRHWSLVRNDRGVPYIVADLLDKSARSSPDHDQSVIDDAKNGDRGAMGRVISWIEEDSHCEETLLRAHWARHALAGNTFIAIGYAEAHRGLTAERTSDGDYLVDCGSDYVLVAEDQWTTTQISHGAASTTIGVNGAPTSNGPRNTNVGPRLTNNPRQLTSSASPPCAGFCI